ncbi:MAG: hypothetical protein BA863_04745 [Desulfovibrio sp. S3730MH75]|nr:MAG: hypothetical protein BA863_04745 [Desulfovibrio sp. S3730MH75]
MIDVFGIWYFKNQNTEVVMSIQKEVVLPCKNCGDLVRFELSGKEYKAKCPVCRSTLTFQKEGEAEFTSCFPPEASPWMLCVGGVMLVAGVVGLIINGSGSLKWNIGVVVALVGGVLLGLYKAKKSEEGTAWQLRRSNPDREEN